MYPSLFDPFFAPSTIVVVSEERLKAAELKAKERQLLQVKVQLENLEEYYEKLTSEVKSLKGSASRVGKDLDSMDKDRDPESLEEALTGE
jgi:predicted  nucleic acid-binding Zn-ribbon protein